MRSSGINGYIKWSADATMNAGDPDGIKRSRAWIKRQALMDVYNSDKKYEFGLAIGDGTAMGNFFMTLAQARAKNKKYENDYFNKVGEVDGVRLKRLVHRNPEDRKTDIHNAMAKRFS